MGTVRLTQPNVGEPIFGDEAALDQIARFYAARQTIKDPRSSDDRQAVAETVDYLLTYLL